VIAAAPSVRSYAAGDQATIVAMLSGQDPWQRLGYTPSDWHRVLDHPLRGREGWVIEESGSAAGIAVLRTNFLVGDYLELFAIAATARGRGLGTALLAAVEKMVFARAPNLFVCVSDFNHQARRFYARNGYQQVGALADLLVAGSSELLLRKTTGPARPR
jgi:[ribosomal protein S18]-alanine N-acetyltransferase